MPEFSKEKYCFNLGKSLISKHDSFYQLKTMNKVRRGIVNKSTIYSILFIYYCVSKTAKMRLGIWSDLYLAWIVVIPLSRIPAISFITE